MSGFQVVAGQIRAAASQMQAAADQVEDASPGGDVAAIATALPGSRSAASTAALADAWRARFRGWHDDAAAQSRRLQASADSYDASDLEADQRLRILMRHTGETLG